MVIILRGARLVHTTAMPLAANRAASTYIYLIFTQFLYLCIQYLFFFFHTFYNHSSLKMYTHEKKGRKEAKQSKERKASVFFEFCVPRSTNRVRRFRNVHEQRELRNLTSLIMLTAGPHSAAVIWEKYLPLDSSTALLSSGYSKASLFFTTDHPSWNCYHGRSSTRTRPSQQLLCYLCIYLRKSTQHRVKSIRARKHDNLQ